MRRILLLLVVLVAPCASAQQLPDSSVTLAEVHRLVATGNLNVLSEQAAADAATMLRPQVTSLPDPMIGTIVRPSDGFRRTMFEARQDFPFPGKRELLGRAADATALAADYGVLALAAEKRLQASHAFFGVGSADAKRTLIDDYRFALIGFEQAALVQYEQGSGPQQAILKIQLEKNMLLQQDAMLRAMRDDARAMLEMLSGLETRLHRFDAAFALPALPDRVPDSLASDAARRRPEVHQLEAEADRIAQEEAYARRSFLPDFSVAATYSAMEGLGVGGGVMIPLWRKPRRAAIEQARLGRLAVDRSQEDLRAQIRSSIDASTARLRSGLETVALLRETLIPQAEAALDATTSAYTNGRTDFLDLLDSQRMLFSLRVDLIDVTEKALQDAATLEFVARAPVLLTSDTN